MAGRSRNSLQIKEQIDVRPSLSGVFSCWRALRLSYWLAECLILTASSGSDQDEGRPDAPPLELPCPPI